MKRLILASMAALCALTSNAQFQGGTFLNNAGILVPSADSTPQLINLTGPNRFILVYFRPDPVKNINPDSVISWQALPGSNKWRPINENKAYATKIALADSMLLVRSWFAGLTTSAVSEGSNLYYTTVRFNSDWNTKTTTDLPEGNNLYYTIGRFNTQFSTKTTSDLIEGTNLYYTTARFNTDFGNRSTTNLVEGTNLYWTNSRFDTRFNTNFAAKSTTDLIEGTNQYFTNTRARSSVSAGTGLSYNPTTGVFINTATYIAPTFNNSPTRSLNTSYQISTTQNTKVSYTVTLATSLALLNLNSAAQVYLEISPNNSTWTTINSAGVSSTLSVAISLGLNQSLQYNIQGEVPTGYYMRLRSVTSGGGTATFTSGQEVQY